MNDANFLETLALTDRRVSEKNLLGIWLKLVQDLASNSKNVLGSQTKPTDKSSRDEEELQIQIQKDVERSFIGYYSFSAMSDIWREKKRRQLKGVLTSFFAHHPVLHYYQGFNTVCAIFVVLQENAQAKTSSTSLKLLNLFSQTHLVDHMSKSFDDTLVYLLLLQDILFTADRKYFNILCSFPEVSSFHFALPWIITCFSHKVNSFQVAQDFITFAIGKHPTASIYLSASLLMHPIVKKWVMAQHRQMVESISNGHEHSFDTAEIYGFLQMTPELVGKNIEFIDLRKIFKSLVAKCPVEELLQTESASKLSDKSVLWHLPRSISAEVRNKIILSKRKWEDYKRKMTRKKRIKTFFRSHAAALTAVVIVLVAVVSFQIHTRFEFVDENQVKDL